MNATITCERETALANASQRPQTKGTHSKVASSLSELDSSVDVDELGNREKPEGDFENGNGAEEYDGRALEYSASAAVRRSRWRKRNVRGRHR